MSRSIKEVVGEFKAAFGELEFKATSNLTGQVVCSKEWKEPVEPVLEITADDYLTVGNLVAGNLPTEGVIAGLMKLELKHGKRK